MTVRRSAVIASLATAPALAVALTLAGQGGTADLAKRPPGAVLDCAKVGGEARGIPGGTFRSANNLIVGPISMTGAGLRPAELRADLGWQKFPTYVRSGHRVTVEISRATWPHAGLIYGPKPRNPQLARWGYRVLTFIPCRSDTFKQNPYSHVACCSSFFAGGIRADAPQCVSLRFWVDVERRPRRGVVYLGVADCA
jgi:hypothetical protein